MKSTMVKALAATAVAAASIAGSVGAAHATDTNNHASTQKVSPRIVGGEQANSPWIVQLAFQQAGQSGTFGCTGELINSEWVLTARHCTQGDTKMNVYFSNSTTDRGTATSVDQFKNSPYGDMGLVHLSQPHESSEYGKLADSFDPYSTQSADIYGYGLRASKARPDHLYTANVSILGGSFDAFGGEAIHVRGNNGASNHGDSGGPIMVNNQIVGTCSTGDSADPGDDIHAGSNYANITGNRDWIKQIAGV